MRANHLTSAILVALSCNILTACCVANPTTAGDTAVDSTHGSAIAEQQEVDALPRAMMSRDLAAESREAVAETAEPLLKVVHCPEGDGVECMSRCADAGISCAAGRNHPYKPGVGLGDLVACAEVPHSCVYSYADGDRCWFVTTLLFPVCRYTGGS